MNQTYTVKAGDTLYGISNQYGVSVMELANINGVTAETLKVGQILKIPNKSGTNPDNMFMYTVKKGDSLYSIANKYNTSVDSIKSLNKLITNNISVGQILRIPEMYTPDDEIYKPNYINYSVKRGDTLYSIAKAYNLSVDDIIKDNALSSNTLTIGQNLKIRVKDFEVLECFGEDYTPPGSVSTIQYKVKKGDSLYSIARQYNTTVNEIVNFNNLKGTNLSIGQVLNIPSTSGSTYIVKGGDSLYSIAKMFNTTVDNIKSKNNLVSNLLRVGQILRI